MTAAANSEQSLPFSPTAHRQVRDLARYAHAGVTVMCGFPAAGKSTATRLLAQLLDPRPIVLDKDTYAPALEESVMTELTGNAHDRDSDTYRRIVAPHIYAALVQQGIRIGQRHPVIIDAPFLGYVTAAHGRGERLSAYIRGIAGGGDLATVRTVWVDTDTTALRARMQQRGADRDRPKLDDWSAYRTGVLDSGLAISGPTVVDYLISN